MTHFFSKKNKYTFLLLCFSTMLCAQDSIRINGVLHNNTRFAKVVVQKFGAAVFDIAAIPLDKEKGSFSIAAPLDVEPGIYRFRYGQTTKDDYIDIIINGKERKIEFTLDVSIDADKRTPYFNHSEENKTWYNFRYTQKLILDKILVQQDFLLQYTNKKDKIYLKIQKEYEKLKKEYNDKRKKFIEKTNTHWAKKAILFDKIYFPSLSNHPKLEEFYAHESFWDEKNTSDLELINAPFYTSAILEYVSFYMNPKMEFSEKEQTNGFKKCVDKIVDVFGKNEKTKEFAIKYLQAGFKEIGNEVLVQYIDEKYAANEQCTSDDDELQKRLKGYETLKTGSLAPEIQLTALDGSTKTLKDYTQDQVVVVFWASWCPHCMEEMPKLQEWAKNQKNTLVLAISLDDDYTAFQNVIEQFPDMLHYCDLQKWKGIIATDYYVAATPTLFLLDKERRILKKYDGIQSFLNEK